VPDSPGFEPINIGTGKGISVLELVKAMSDACGHQIAYKIVSRRPGDVATVYADASMAKKLLNWEATKSIKDMCDDVWHWQSSNPNGFL